MTAYLRRLAAQALGLSAPGAIRPRLPALFEPAGPPDDAAGLVGRRPGEPGRPFPSGPAAPQPVDTDSAWTPEGAPAVRYGPLPSAAPRESQADAVTDPVSPDADERGADRTGPAHRPSPAVRTVRRNPSGEPVTRPDRVTRPDPGPYTGPGPYAGPGLEPSERAAADLAARAAVAPVTCRGGASGASTPPFRPTVPARITAITAPAEPDTIPGEPARPSPSPVSRRGGGSRAAGPIVGGRPATTAARPDTDSPAAREPERLPDTHFGTEAAEGEPDDGHAAPRLPAAGSRPDRRVTGVAGAEAGWTGTRRPAPAIAPVSRRRSGDAVVRVTIGRIEVRAAAPPVRDQGAPSGPPAPAAPPGPPEPAVSLEHYLDRHLNRYADRQGWTGHE